MYNWSMDGIKLAELQDIAIKHGFKSSAVRSAVNKKLIHPARQYGIARGKGTKWLYPPGTDKALREAFKLLGNECEGGALRFELWWGGMAPHSKWINEYCLSVLKASGKTLQFQISRSLKERERNRRNKYPKGSTLTPSDEAFELLESVDVRLAKELTDVVITLAMDTLEEIDPASIVGAIILKRSLNVFASNVMRINSRHLLPDFFPLTALFIMKLEEPPKTSPNDYLFDELTKNLQTGNFFDKILKYIKDADEADYKKALGVIQSEPKIMRTIRTLTTVFKRELRITGNESPWVQQQLGPFRNPELAIQGMCVGTLVGLSKWKQVRKLINN